MRREAIGEKSAEAVAIDQKSRSSKIPPISLISTQKVSGTDALDLGVPCWQ
jgi:hypothetical protein